MIKFTRNGYCDHVQGIRNLSACVENSGELGWVVSCCLGGERWDGKEEEEEKKKKEKQRKRVSAEGAYIMVFTDGIIDRYIPSVIPSVTVSCHRTVISV
jgi:hypothetical protein